MHDTLIQPTHAPDAVATPRRDLYHAIHKGVRLMFADTIGQLGAVDPDDATALPAALAQCGELLDLLELHYADEDNFMHPALERAQPGSTGRIAAEHLRHRDGLEAMRELIEVVRASEGRTRGIAVARLYRAVALAMAEDLEHMDYEETEFNAILWRHYSDAELAALEQALLASIPPPLMMLALRWMIPALNAGERAAFLAEAGHGMPPEAFVAVLGEARRVLPSAEWDKLARALGV